MFVVLKLYDKNLNYTRIYCNYLRKYFGILGFIEIHALMSPSWFVLGVASHDLLLINLDF